MAFAYISHRDCSLHDMGASHPERPSRFFAIDNAIRESELKNQLQFYEAPFATIDQLQRVHVDEYVETIFALGSQNEIVDIDADTILMPFTLSAALRAAGAGILAVDLVMQNKVSGAFCNVRPPGHHAERDRAMGFCFFNNVAVAAAYALSEYDLQRVAIVDFDVHHGNGTEDIFKNDSRVLLCSSFQYPFYPFSGDALNRKNMCNILLPAGSTGEAFREKVQELWLPTLRKFKPELIFFSAGFDAHENDQLANLRFKEEDYGWVSREVKKIADMVCKGRLISMLEGGYDLDALAKSVIEHIRGMIEA